MTRPMASISTANEGYQTTGTGLDMGFADWAFQIENEIGKENQLDHETIRSIDDLIEKKQNPRNCIPFWGFRGL